MKHNLICLHWGDRYGPEYVMNLWNGANRFSTTPFDFHVLTDNARQHPQNLGWYFHHAPLWDNTEPWWYKMLMFGLPVDGINLYMDLDVVLVNSIDKFWKFCPGEFVILQDFNRQFVPDYKRVNSSIMRWQDSSMNWLTSMFVNRRPHSVSSFRGDQDYIDHHTTNRELWPREWAMSWKWEVNNGGVKHPGDRYQKTDEIHVPPDTSVLVFHGTPKPHEVDAVYPFWNRINTTI